MVTYINTKDNTPLVSIQILNWNRAEETIRAIESALNQSYKNIEVIVIDNGSVDHSIQLIKEKFPDVVLLELDKNYGCPGGRNKGIPYCNGEFIFYLDNDGVLHEDAVLHAYESISEEPNIGIVTGKVYDFSDFQEVDVKCHPLSFNKYRHITFQGGISLHRKDIYKKVGNYPPHFMYGGEEYYLSLKLFDSDTKIIKDESVILWHKRSDLMRNRTNELLGTYFNKLYANLCLLPSIEAMKFFLYFLFVYPYYAYKNRFLFTFFRRSIIELPKLFKKAIKNREPIKQSAYNELKKLQLIKK